MRRAMFIPDSRVEGFPGLHPSFSCRELETSLVFLGCVYVFTYTDFKSISS